MIKINDDVYINPDDLVSVQKEVFRYESGSPSDSNIYEKFAGSVITMKNGRKVFVKDLWPHEIMAKFEPAIGGES